MTGMTTTEDKKSGIVRFGPLVLIVTVAALGAFALRDYLGFEALRDNREALLAFRDSHFVPTIGATLIFLVARMGLGEKLKARMETSAGMVARIKKGLDENQWSMLFFIRLVPAVPFFVANLIPAFLGVPLRRFVISTFLGIIPGSLVYTSVGAGLGEVFARGETPNFGIIFEPHILLPILGLCALSLLPVVIKALTGKKDL